MEISDLEMPTVIDYDNDPEEGADQMEMFLHKFPEVRREDMSNLLECFQTVDIDGDGLLEENQSLRLWERQGKPLTIIEFRKMAAQVLPLKKGKKMNFLECATCFYEKSWEDLHKFVDKKAYEQAIEKLEHAKRTSEEARAALEGLKLKEQEEEQARTQVLQAKETEVHVVGVKGAAEFFQQQINAASDTMSEQMMRVKAASEQRKQIKQAKELELQAKEQAERAQNSALVRENAEKEMASAKAKAEEDRQRQEEEELEAKRKRRAEFKAKNEALFGGGTRKS